MYKKFLLVSFAFLAFYLATVFLTPKTVFAFYPNECGSGSYTRGDCQGVTTPKPNCGASGEECCQNAADAIYRDTGQVLTTSCSNYCALNIGPVIYGVCPVDPNAFQQMPFHYFCCNYTGPTPTLPPPPTPTPTIIPCSGFTSCNNCIFAVNNGGPNNCGWNGGSCEAGTASCPFGNSQWYWTTCAINECPVPTTPPTPTPTPTPGQCQQNSDCGTPANSCTTVYCLNPPNGICVYNPAPAGTVCDTNGSVCDGNGTCLVPTPTPTPVPSTVTIQGHHVDSSGNDLVLAGQKVTVNTVPSSSKTDSPTWFFNTLSPSSYTATADNISGYATSYSLYSCTNLSCPSPLTHTTYTSGNSVSNIPLPTSGNYADIFFKYTPTCAPGTIYTITGKVTGQPSAKALTVCRDPNTPGSCTNAADSTKTNPVNGSYTLSNISSDTYHLIYLDPTSLPVNYSVSSTNPVNISSNTCPSNINFTISTAATPTPTPTPTPRS